MLFHFSLRFQIRQRLNLTGVVQTRFTITPSAIIRSALLITVSSPTLRTAPARFSLSQLFVTFVRLGAVLERAIPLLLSLPLQPLSLAPAALGYLADVALVGAKHSKGFSLEPVILLSAVLTVNVCLTQLA